MADLKKPKAVACVACGEPAKPELRPAVEVKGVVVFPAKWIERVECEACERKRFAADEQAEVARLTRENLQRAGLGDAVFQSMEFKHYRTDHPARERVAGMVRPVYSELSRTGRVRNLLMYGGAGGGKTMLAACFAKAAIARRLRTKFVVWPEACLTFRQWDLEGRKLELVQMLASYDVLAIDDLGTEKPTDFVVENLYLLTNRWWNAQKQGLIITTNLPIHEIGRIYGDRVSSRLGGMSVLVDFEGCPDGRIENLL